MGQPILRALFRRCGHHLAKTLLWDHPIARKLDHEVHRRRMAGESYFSYLSLRGPFPYTLFSFLDVFPGMDFLREVLWPVHLCPYPRQCRLSWAARYWGPTISR